MNSMAHENLRIHLLLLLNHFYTLQKSSDNLLDYQGSNTQKKMPAEKLEQSLEPYQEKLAEKDESVEY